MFFKSETAPAEVLEEINSITDSDWRPIPWTDQKVLVAEFDEGFVLWNGKSLKLVDEDFDSVLACWEASVEK